MAIRHIIWDWNGTLLNDVELCLRLGNLQFREQGLRELTMAEYRDAVAHPVEEFYRSLGFDFSRKPYAQLTQEFHDRYLEGLHDLALFEDVKSVLEGNYARAVTQSILSAHPQEILSKSVALRGIDPFFNAIVGLDHNRACSKVTRGREWFAISGLDPAQVLLVGDTDHDVELAEALGIECHLVARGFQSAARLARTGRPVYGSLSELFSKVEVG